MKNCWFSLIIAALWLLAATAQAADMREDFWEGGQRRSQEPLRDGKPHGLAKYWHANGQPYAEITYINGKKDGQHTLYREDGTPEQSLSYQNGQPHGILTWYKADGTTIDQQWRYDNGKGIERLDTQSATRATPTPQATRPAPTQHTMPEPDQTVRRHSGINNIIYLILCSVSGFFLIRMIRKMHRY